MSKESLVTEAITPFLDHVRLALDQALGDQLVAVYLFGSGGGGDFIPERSDLDLLVVVERPLTLDVKSALVRALWRLEPPPTVRGVETRFVARADLSPEGISDLYVSTHPGEPSTRDRAADRDMLLELAAARVRSRPIFGPPAEEVIPPFDHRSVLGAMMDDVARCIEDSPETYTVLTAARTAAFHDSGQWMSKIEGGRWAIERGDDRELLERAIRAHLGEIPDRPITARGRRYANKVIESLRAELAGP